jgi:hypothetical protein
MCSEAFGMPGASRHCLVELPLGSAEDVAQAETNRARLWASSSPGAAQSGEVASGPIPWPATAPRAKTPSRTASSGDGPDTATARSGDAAPHGGRSGRWGSLVKWVACERHPTTEAACGSWLRDGAPSRSSLSAPRGRPSLAVSAGLAPASSSSPLTTWAWRRRVLVRVGRFHCCSRVSRKEPGQVCSIGIEQRS